MPHGDETCSRSRRPPTVRSGFRQLCKVSAAPYDDPSDPVVRATFEAVAAYEQTLHDKHGKNVSASRTRQKIAKKGVYQSLIEWSGLHGNRPGFQHLIEAGLPEFTFEAVVIRFAERFPPDAVAACRETLRKAGAPEKLLGSQSSEVRFTGTAR